eukprot:TRINITY_DN49265_c0_g1_i1.p1 TRINITY_DN49265_c0_g1~~TRINITY_DN49265_c0_g1_i1.p1  ORF type:complete len:779 (+),score=160.04 TRINITY_DN49265_c0_g1_i1:109-2445(+)
MTGGDAIQYVDRLTSDGARLQVDFMSGTPSQDAGAAHASGGSGQPAAQAGSSPLGPVKKYEVVGEPAVNVRIAMNSNADRVAMKYKGETFMGQKIGEWVKILGGPGPGYMMISHPMMGALLREVEGGDVSTSAPPVPSPKVSAPSLLSATTSKAPPMIPPATQPTAGTGPRNLGQTTAAPLQSMMPSVPSVGMHTAASPMASYPMHNAAAMNPMMSGGWYGGGMMPGMANALSMQQAMSFGASAMTAAGYNYMMPTMTAQSLMTSQQPPKAPAAPATDWKAAAQAWVAGAQSRGDTANSAADATKTAGTPLWQAGSAASQPAASLAAAAQAAARAPSKPQDGSALQKSPSVDAFKEGDKVEYWSGTHSRWVNSQVKDVCLAADGTVDSYNLTTKPNAKPNLVRRRRDGAEEKTKAQRSKAAEKDDKKGEATGADAYQTFSTGAKVFYWSSKSSTWMQAVVTADKEEDGQKIYELICTIRPEGNNGGDARKRCLKIQGATSDRLRARGRGLKRAAAGQQPAAKRQKGEGGGAAGGRPEEAQGKSFAARMKSRQKDAKMRQKQKKPLEPCAVGDRAFLWLPEDKERKWREATVKVVHSDETGKVTSYDMETEPGVISNRVPAKHVRRRKQRPSSAVAPAQVFVFSVGDKVRYWSATNAKWVQGKITQVHLAAEGGPVQHYDLNLKAKVEPHMVRPPNTPSHFPAPVAPEEAAAAPPLESFAVDDKVRYWSKAQAKWLSGMVTEKKDVGGEQVYVVQCKRMFVNNVAADRLRRRVTKEPAK